MSSHSVIIKKKGKTMALLTSSITNIINSLVVVLLISTILMMIPISYSLSLSLSPTSDSDPPLPAAAAESETHLVEFPLNLEYLEAEFFLHGATGQGLDFYASDLADGGPPPIGAKKANLDFLIKDIIFQFGLQEIGHLRAIKRQVNGFPRPLLNISKEAFAQVINSAFERPLVPPFDTYANSINYLIASYVIPYVGLTGYVGASPKLLNFSYKKLTASLLGVESGQDAVIRTLLYELRDSIVSPYGISVEEFTNRISMLRNKLGKQGIKDEGLEVPISQGAEGKVSGNVLAGDQNSVAYERSPEEVLRIVYGTSDEHVPGGFYPKGANGHIANSYLPPSN